MSLNQWWRDDPRQRYWLEITDRFDVGDLLQAPNSGHNAHELVSAVNVGDRVLHWVKSQGLVGWSEVAVLPDLRQGWNDGGWYDSQTPPVWHVGPWWVVSLSGLTRFATAVTHQQLLKRREQVLDIQSVIQSRQRGATYAPFTRQDGIRARQGYFAKWPYELFEAFPEAIDARGNTPMGSEVDEEAAPQGRSLPTGVTAWMQDPRVRKALERHAVERAVEHYQQCGATDIVELVKPYDLRLQLDGDERHVEVKGSSVGLSSVELTKNEVRHARAYAPTDLVVVDNIKYDIQAESDVVNTSGGRLRIWEGRTPAGQDLVPTKYAYNLPPQR